MATLLNEPLRDIRDKISTFATQFVAPRVASHDDGVFPPDIWEKMGKEQILAVGIPPHYGGLAGNYCSISIAGEAMARWGHDMGLTLSWLIHQITACFFIHEFGTEAQRQIYLPEMARGAVTASVAISEPEVKAHPKYITTSAHLEDTAYRITGAKSYLTNGPIAHLFIVFAVTGSGSDGQKEFTAFLVPKDTEGLTITKEISFDFLTSSPHCEISLSACPVPGTSILGRPGLAFTDMAKPFRDYEETCLMGPVVGGTERQIEILVNLLHDAGAESSDELKSALGQLHFTLDTLRIVAYEAASMLDSAVRHPEFSSLLLSFRDLSGKFQVFLQHVITEFGVETNRELDTLAKDISTIINIAQYVALIKQRKLGQSLLSRKESYL